MNEVRITAHIGYRPIETGQTTRDDPKRLVENFVPAAEHAS